MPTISAAAAGAMTLALAACFFDCRSARIPNALTVFGLLTGIAFAALTGGWQQVLWSIAGVVTGFALFFPFFALGGMGAGDVKLLAALGGWLGPVAAVWLALYSAICGGILAVAVALVRGYLKTALSNVWALAGFWRVAGLRPLDGMTLVTARSPRLPYAVPVTAGLLLALWLH